MTRTNQVSPLSPFHFYLYFTDTKGCDIKKQTEFLSSFGFLSPNPFGTLLKHHGALEQTTGIPKGSDVRGNSHHKMRSELQIAVLKEEQSLCM